MPCFACPDCLPQCAHTTTKIVCGGLVAYLPLTERWFATLVLLCECRADVANTSADPSAAEGKKVMGEFELQTHMVNYEEKGTFDDFNEMAIQYLSYSGLERKNSMLFERAGISPPSCVFSLRLQGKNTTNPQRARGIRYGYISLFSPSFPVAPLLVRN